MKRRLTKLNIIWVTLILLLTGSCSLGTSKKETSEKNSFLWENANIYFLLTDRFLNGDPSNDLNFERKNKTAIMRGFEGGDITGVIKKLEEGYFKKLGVTALWLTPWFEQIHGSTDEGTGVTYGYHGYWTSMGPNFGTEKEAALLIKTAHSQSYESTLNCTLVENLPDIRTGSDQEVDLPPSLLEKWEKEGRLEIEMAENNSRNGFFIGEVRVDSEIEIVLLGQI
jgi:alpha-amylase